MSRYNLFKMILATLLFTPHPSIAASPMVPKFERQCYDEKGNTSSKKNTKTTCFNLGERSFADAVENYADEAPAFQHGKSYGTSGIATNAIGPPKTNKYVSLGCHGSLTLHMTDNVIVDRQGPDLIIFSDGKNAEPAEISISADGKKFYPIGQTDTKKVKGEAGTLTALFDIGGKPLIEMRHKKFSYVKIVDKTPKKNNCYYPAAGIDINAVGAIHSDIALRGICQFAPDSYVLDKACLAKLQQLAKELKKRPALNLLVEGHTDNEGSKAHNGGLSKNRAKATRRALLQLLPHLKKKIDISVEGEANPTHNNKTEQGRAKNRRTDIILSF